MRGGLGGAPDVVELHLILDRNIDGLKRRHVHRRADQGAFGAGAVVAADVDDQGVVELAHVFHGLDHTTDLVVGVGRVAGKDLGLTGEELLLLGAERVPLRQLGAAVLCLSIGPGGELGVRRDHTELLLVGEDLLAQLVPAHVELALELVAPFLLRMVGRMGAAGDVVAEERLVRRGGIELLQMVDRVVRHAGDHVVVRVVAEREDLRGVAEEERRPLVGLAAHEPVEVLEAHADGPLGERAGRAVLVRRRVVVLAEPRGGVAVLLQDLTDRAVIDADGGVVARVAGGLLGDDPEAHGVVAAAGDDGRPRRASRARWS